MIYSALSSLKSQSLLLSSHFVKSVCFDIVSVFNSWLLRTPSEIPAGRQQGGTIETLMFIARTAVRLFQNWYRREGSYDVARAHSFGIVYIGGPSGLRDDCYQRLRGFTYLPQ